MSGSTGANQPSYAQDVVAVYDGDFNQLFAAARPMKAAITAKSKVMRHPVETGATVSDFRVFDPIKISLPVVLDAADFVNTYNAIKLLYQGETLVSIQTKVEVYQNLILSEMPHDEAPEVFNTIKMTLTFEEVQFAQVSKSALPPPKAGGNVAAKPASNTQANAASEKAGSAAQNGSTAHNIYSYFTGGGK